METPAGSSKEQVAYTMNSHVYSRIDRQLMRALYDPVWRSGLKQVNAALLPGNLNFAYSPPAKTISARELNSLEQESLTAQSQATTARSRSLTTRSEGWQRLPSHRWPLPDRSTYAACFSGGTRSVRGLPGGAREIWNLGRQGKQFTSHDNILYKRHY